VIRKPGLVAVSCHLVGYGGSGLLALEIRWQSGAEEGGSGPHGAGLAQNWRDFMLSAGCGARRMASCRDAAPQTPPLTDWSAARGGCRWKGGIGRERGMRRAGGQEAGGFAGADQFTSLPGAGVDDIRD